MIVHISVRNADTNAPRVSWNMGMLQLLHVQSYTVVPAPCTVRDPIKTVLRVPTHWSVVAVTLGCVDASCASSVAESSVHFSHRAQPVRRTVSPNKMGTAADCGQ